MEILFLKKIDIYYAKWAMVVQRFLVSLTKLGTYDGIRWFDGMFQGLLDPHPDPLDRGTDPRILMGIRTKMSRFHNTGYNGTEFY
jgi:hypothetical protein